jgi:hypothetical protein
MATLAYWHVRLISFLGIVCAALLFFSGIGALIGLLERIR